jgi:osmoprotectant transport system permease protein
VCPKYVRTRSSDLTAALTQHVELTTVSVLIGLAVALPLAVVARRLRLSSLLLGTATVVYTVPSLALFSLLVPFTGLSSTTVVIGLVLYSLTILLRNVLAGLDGVAADVREAARGMGFGRTRLLLRVELPLALPTIMAGLRVATVSTVALTTIGFLVGSGGLGNLIQDGLQSNFKAEVLTASVLCVLLAVVADLLLLVVQRVLTPWARSQS